MQAMRLGAGRKLECVSVPRPRPATGQLLVKVHACGVCRTDLHIIDGEWRNALPITVSRRSASVLT